ncbi:zinc finger protein ZFP2-like [Toxorhynchites rutilus septentrionalis]|uniref:zinc finger protein ZFP2-like n=1 Tax=Toxorhynchites rutilus septentrionalis TaxID=329112 RepID=UPI00247A4F35|nr:zinc finger protein ZFP2-like [Toxorhynchites rutilus septentrionalis]
MDCVENDTSKSSICRICMENHPEMVSIFSKLDDAFIAHTIIECTAVQIAEDDGLPEIICKSCVGELSGYKIFIERAKESDRKLRETLKTQIKLERDDLEEFENTDHAETIAPHHELISVDLKVESQTESGEYIRNQSEEEEGIDFESCDYIRNSISDENFETCTADSAVRKKRARMKHDGEEDKEGDCNQLDELDNIEQETYKIVDVYKQLVCCSCFKLFGSLEELKEHGKNVHESTRRPNMSKKHICEFCFRRYASATALRMHHKKVNRIKRVFQCVKCETCFTDPSKRRYHAHNHPIASTRSSVIMATVPAQVQEKMGIICCAQNCHKAFDTEQQLMEHSADAHKANKVHSILNSSEQRPVECPICYKRFMDEAGLRVHQQRVYIPKKHVCSICGLKFYNTSECDRHEREHRNEKIFKCELCPKAYFGMDQLKLHLRRHSATREFMCNICGQSYTQRHNLQAHMLMHEGRLPFECEVCKKAFRVKAKMIYHMRVHSGERPYPCRYCDMAFADSTNRTRHEMSHTGIKPYKCEYCEKTFITKRLKKEHENTHSGEKSYKCKVCSQVFDNSSTLKIHLKQHMEDTHEEV